MFTPFLRILLLVIFLSGANSFAQGKNDELDAAFIAFDAKQYEKAFPIILKYAKEGNPKAQGTIARMHGNGWGTQKDPREAFYWASRGAQKNDPASQNVIGILNMRGDAGFKQNDSEAIIWFEKAAQQKYMLSLKNLMVIYKRTNNFEKQIYWGTRLFELGDSFAAVEVSLAYKNFKGEPNHLAKSFEWAMKGALAGNVESINLVGEAYRLGNLGQIKDEKEALRWFTKSAQKGSKSAYYLIGLIYNNGDLSLIDEKKAIDALENSQKLGRDEATFILARQYLFGRNGSIKQNKLRGYKLLNELQKSNSSYLAYELESQIYAEGLDRPSNKQKSILLALKGLNVEWGTEHNWEKKLIGSWTGQAILGNNFLEEIGLPEIYEIAWFRIYEGINSEGYQEFRTNYSPEILQKSESISFPELLKATLDFIENRRQDIGPIEADDLINEGWAQFTGKRGKVNEPLAQLLTEEGLRLAIRTKSKLYSDYAKNNLGVILNDAANLNVRNSRLAQIHLFDGQDSSFGPSNLLWDEYIGEISLTEKEKNVLKERYFKKNNNEHISFTLPKLPDDVKGSRTRIIEFLIQNYKVGNKELAKNIAFLYESNATTKQDYEKSLYWFKLAQDNERAERIQRIINGDYEKGMPNFTGTVNQLFEVDLVDTRGALLTSLSSAFTPLRNTPLNLEKSKRKLNLHAIVIGNAAYKVKPLKNSANDAKAIANKFRSFGFEVTEVIDADRRKFRETLVNFSERSKNSDVTVFYYAGHGMQLGGINYLLPTDIDFSMPESVVTYDGLSLNDIKNRSLPGSTKLIFLDACRNNPFESTVRGNQSGGLAPVNVGTGTLISFATRDGSVALDSVGGQHSPYTQALLKYLDTNDDVELMLRTVGDEVLRLTKNRQEPWKYGALSGQKVILPMLAK